MVRFANPEFLYLLILLPVLVLLFVLYRRSQRRLIAKFGDMELLRALMPGYAPKMGTVKFVLVVVAVGLIVVAFARPQVGSKLREVDSRGGKIILAVDVSRSMLAEDYAPNRLERTKNAIGRLFERLEDEQVGLVVFAGDGYVQLPITGDYRSAANFVRALSPDMVARQGTSLQRAIEVSTLAMPSATTEDQSANDRTIILITDGESHDDDPIAAAEVAASQGITIHTIGIGTAEGAPITIDGEIIKDDNGEIVVSKLDEEMLAQIAATTGGVYARSSQQSVGLDEIMTRISEMEKSDSTTVIFEEYAEQFFYLLYIAIGLLLIQFFLPNHRRVK